MKEIILAGGCFWGIEEYFSKIHGVVDTKVGYVNGITKNPSYEDVCNGNTGYAEGCYIKFDESIITLIDLLDKFWYVIDPTILNRQGPDVGYQYRSGIYYYDKIDLDNILKSKNKLSGRYEKPIVTEVEEVRSFYLAEEYHQKYLKKNTGGYCHINLDN